MISELSTSPKPSNNKGRILFFVLLTLTAAFSLLYLLIERYKGVIGAVCVIFAVGAIYVYNRYMAMVYCYDVMLDSSNTPLFIIRQIIGRRESTVCRVELSEVHLVERVSREQARERVAAEGCVRYCYVPTLMPESTIRLAVKTRYECAEITIEGSDEYAALLSSYADEARQSAYRSTDADE